MLLPAFLGVAACRPPAPPAPVLAPARPAASLARRPAPPPSAVVIGADRLPASLRIAGTFVTAVEWRDALGKNLVVVSESSELRHEPGVRWSPTEFVAHTVSHYAGAVPALRGREDLLWLCSNPERGHEARTPQVTDVDGDGIAEVTGALVTRCGAERGALPWAFEGGVDLFHKPPEGRALCGGDGRMSASLRDTPFEGHLREAWLRASGLVQATTTPASAGRELRWRDATGENAFVTARRVEAGGAVRLSATQLRRGPSGWAVIQKLDEAREACPEDDATAFRPPWVLTDLDRDGIREVTFAFTTGCVSDVSSVNLVLVMFEDRERHAVRGKTWIGSGLPDDDCLPARPLLLEDDPILRLLDRLDPQERLPR